MHKLLSIIAGLIVPCLFSSFLWAQEAQSDYRNALMKLTLYVPEDPKEREYLGIKSSSGKMSLTQIKSEILVIEIFSMYCPHCQKHAPTANKLYHAIDSRKEFRDKIKFIGIGVGNSQYEVGIFRQKYSPPFPLFDDRACVVANSFTGIRTPYYLGIRVNNGSSFEIFYSNAGGFTDAEEFLNMIVKESGIQRGGSR